MSTGMTGVSSGSGIDIPSTVEQVLYVERAPERLIEAQQSRLAAQKSALQDLQRRLESFEDVVNQLKSYSGPLSAKVASSSDASVCAVSAQQNASAGTHTVVVDHLATTSSVFTDPVSSSGFSAGELVLQIGGGEEITIEFGSSETTLAAAAEVINSKQAGVSARVVTDTSGSRLALVSETSGTSGDIEIISAPEGLRFNVGTRGVDASVAVDGVPITSSTNTIKDVVQGLTLELASAAPGKQIRISVASDTGRAKQAIRNFVETFNTLIITLNQQFTYDQGTKSAGVLAGDASARTLQWQLLGITAYEADGATGPGTLRSIGIEMQNDGTLSINDSRLDGVLRDDLGGMISFWQGAAGNGFAFALGTQLGKLTDSVDGPLSVGIKGLEASNKDLADRIEQFELRMELRRQILTAEYTRINTLLQQFSLTQQQLTAQLGSTKK